MQKYLHSTSWFVILASFLFPDIFRNHVSVKGVNERERQELKRTRNRKFHGKEERKEERERKEGKEWGRWGGVNYEEESRTKIG